jgi:type II secretory pathway pseudopilin PulG
MRCLTVRPTATRRRRGLTLVELLVSIALMLLIMSIIVAVFTAATGAMTTAKRDQELGSVARRLEGVIQQDLRGPPDSPRPSTRPTTSATSSTARARSMIPRGRTPTTTSPSPSGPPSASRSPAG